MLLYKIVSNEVYESFKKEGIFRGAEIDLKDGYIHFSTRENVKETCALHFKARDNLTLFAVEGDQYGASLKWEPSRGGVLFPHLFTSIKIEDVIFAKKLKLDKNGGHIFPAELTS